MTRQPSPRILLVDIETFPILAHVWEVYEANALDVVTHSLISCFSAKWLGGKQITKALPDYAGYKAGSEDDRRLVRDLWRLLDVADVVVWQNGDKFDRRKINARIIKHGMNPPSPYKTVDTLKEARRTFGFPSRKLDSMGEYLGIGRKVHTGGFLLWQKCMKGEAAAWKKFKQYCAQDVRLLEAIYLKFRPWMTSHPNVGVWAEDDCCPRCGSNKVQSRGSVRTVTTQYQRGFCGSCGGWFRFSKAQKTIGIRAV